MQRTVPFSPPDISQAEIDEVVDTLKSGWITTGPKTKELERRLAAFTGAGGVACVSSATAALECILHLLGVREGDEVVVPAYTYTATCSPVCHVGATPVMCDSQDGAYDLDLNAVAAAVTPRTKAIVAVDLGGRMADCRSLLDIAEATRPQFRAASDVQEALGRIAVIADAAHALGAVDRGVRAGSAADFSSFSFHAVKNFTTAEGGALAWRAGLFDDDALYRQAMLLSLHGQTKDALAKAKGGSWEYDVVFPGWKCNMTDIQAALGLAQLKRYPSLLARRRAMVARYEANLAHLPISWLRHYEGADGASAALAADGPARLADDGFSSSGHLMMVSLDGRSAAFRNALIEELAASGVAANVHYKPLPLLSAYRDLGFDPRDFPHATALFEREVTLPLHTLLADDDIDYVCDAFAAAYAALDGRGLR